MYIDTYNKTQKHSAVIIGIALGLSVTEQDTCIIVYTVLKRNGSVHMLLGSERTLKGL